MRLSRTVIALFLAAAVLFGAALPASGSGAPVEGSCYGAGYWRTHPEYWPLDSLTLVYGTTYTKLQMVEFMSTSPKGDMSYAFFRQYVAARLNQANGAGPFALSPHQALYCSIWASENPPGSAVRATDPAWTLGSGEAVANALETYNMTGQAVPWSLP